MECAEPKESYSVTMGFMDKGELVNKRMAIDGQLMFGHVPLDFEIQKAEKKRDDGIKRAADHAGKEWTEGAFEILKQFLRGWPADNLFMGEDVRFYADRLGYSKPPHLRAWGAVLVRAAREGFILNAGSDKVKDPNGHRGFATRWRKNNG